MWKHSHHLPGQKNLAGTDGRRGEGEKNRERVCVCGWEKEKERPFFCSEVSPYDSQNKSAIRAKDAPQKPLSCFPRLSSQHDSFLSTPPLPPFSSSPPFCHTLALTLLPMQESAHNLTLEENASFLSSIQSICLSYTRSDLLCVQLLSVLCTSTLFTLSAANFPPYPSLYLQ